jgi:TolB-like protein
MAMRESVGPFRLLRVLGEGGMGIVYEARDERADRLVALKMLRPSTGDAVSRERLRREAHTASGIQHAHICQVYEVGGDEDLYVAMELLDGEPLSARVARGPIPPTEAIPVALQVLDALGALHARKVLHRDLKPSNVFLTSQGVKILDFGLALALADAASEARLTQTGAVLGTPQYMAPERWTDEHNVGPESDIFSVGALLFEMLTGKVPFEGRTPVETAQMILSQRPPSLGATAEFEALDRVIHTALARRAQDRFPTAAAMTLALSTAERDLPATATATVSRSVTRLVVIPFRFLRPEPEVDFLGPGIADAVTTALSAVRSLVLRSPQAGARFAVAAPDFGALARELGVDAVVAGTLLRAGRRLRVTAQLVDVPEATVLWGETFNADVEDVLQLQDDLSRRVVESLAIPLSARDVSGMLRKTPATARANEIYMRANQVANDLDLLAKARDLYKECLEEDPRFAPAWARLGRAHRVLAKYGFAAPEENRRAAEEAFHKALELDPDLPLAHHLYTYYEVEEGGHARDAMVRLLGRVRVRPAEADVFAALVLACRFCGLLDASIAADRRARRLEPGIRTSVAFTHWMRGDPATAISLDDDRMRWLRLYALPLLDRESDAIEVARDMEAHVAGGLLPMVVTTSAALREDRALCVSATESLFARGLKDPESLYICARNLSRVGALDSALATLRRVVDGGYHNPGALERDPWLAPVRSMAAFEAVLASARAGRRASLDAYREAGGPSLLGAEE